MTSAIQSFQAEPLHTWHGKWQNVYNLKNQNVHLIYFYKEQFSSIFRPSSFGDLSERTGRSRRARDELGNMGGQKYASALRICSHIKPK